MRIGKNILLFVFILIISLNVTVYAQENGEKTENPVKVTQEAENDKDVLFTNSKGETVYTLSATTRDREGAIMMPKDRILCLTSETVDLSDIEVLIDDSNEQAKKDLEYSKDLCEFFKSVCFHGFKLGWEDSCKKRQ